MARRAQEAGECLFARGARQFLVGDHADRRVADEPLAPAGLVHAGEAGVGQREGDTGVQRRQGGEDVAVDEVFRQGAHLALGPGEGADLADDPVADVPVVEDDRRPSAGVPDAQKVGVGPAQVQAGDVPTAPARKQIEQFGGGQPGQPGFGAGVHG
ncbi:hypothetical protein ACIO6U_08970 [Streptomyces sp. NPDC087422]|uniref:hypothetical protein n=1 Tax=Streptomyces sp. NPDC087422 TaxID=3365786 RepID=UPI00380CEAB5